MKIKKAEFAACAVAPDGYPKDNLPDIVLIGRSNVGKSSLINRLINRKGLAKTSSTPGKTRTINFYRINELFYLVDLPGYGYAKVPLSERRSWKSMIDEYFEERGSVAGGLVVLDIRRDPGEVELSLYEWFDSYGVGLTTVLTKADKFSANKKFSRTSSIRKALGIDDPVIFSAVSGDGKDELWKRIGLLLKAGEERS